MAGCVNSAANRVTVSMTVEPEAAYEFLQGYKQLLLRLSGRDEDNRRHEMLGQLHMGREVLVAAPGGPGSVLTELSDNGARIPENVASAIQSLQVEHWVYLRDTKRHSIFVHPECTAAYGVLGLTDPIRAITQGTGIAVRTGIVRYRGRYVCDGLLSGIVSLGKGYRRSFTAAYRKLKAEGKFYVDC